jgi:heme exporter protein B
MLRDALLVAGKDLRLEARSRVALNQVAPFAVLVLLLFAFALDADSGVLTGATPGLFWVTVLFSALLAIQRGFAVEAADGTRDGLRLSGLDPAGVFLGKAGAIVVQLLVLEALLGFGVALLYGAALGGPVLLVATALVATLGLAAAGSLYGVLAAGLRVGATLLPLLLLPVVAPVLIAATQAFAAAAQGVPGEGWRWFGLLAVFALIYITFGIFAFESLLEES